MTTENFFIDKLGSELFEGSNTSSVRLKGKELPQIVVLLERYKEEFRSSFSGAKVMASIEKGVAEIEVRTRKAWAKLSVENCSQTDGKIRLVDASTSLPIPKLFIRRGIGENNVGELLAGFIKNAIKDDWGIHVQTPELFIGEDYFQFSVRKGE